MERYQVQQMGHSLNQLTLKQLTLNQLTLKQLNYCTLHVDEFIATGAALDSELMLWPFHMVIVEDIMTL